MYILDEYECFAMVLSSIAVRVIIIIKIYKLISKYTVING